MTTMPPATSDPQVDAAMTHFDSAKDRLFRSVASAAKVADKWYTALDSIAEFEGLGMTPEQQLDAIRKIARGAL